jgi:hypothetical protein
MNPGPAHEALEGTSDEGECTCISGHRYQCDNASMVLDRQIKELARNAMPVIAFD